MLAIRLRSAMDIAVASVEALTVDRNSDRSACSFHLELNASSSGRSLRVSTVNLPLFEYACLVNWLLGGRCLLQYSCSSVPNRPSGSTRYLDLIRVGWLYLRLKILPLGIRPVGVQFNALNQSNHGLASCSKMGFELETGPSHGRFWSSNCPWCFRGCFYFPLRRSRL